MPEIEIEIGMILGIIIMKEEARKRKKRVYRRKSHVIFLFQRPSVGTHLKRKDSSKVSGRGHVIIHWRTNSPG